MLRKCITCKEEKELTDFSPMRSGKYGRASRCRECCRITALVIRLKEKVHHESEIIESLKRRVSKLDSHINFLSAKVIRLEKELHDLKCRIVEFNPNLKVTEGGVRLLTKHTGFDGELYIANLLNAMLIRGESYDVLTHNLTRIEVKTSRGYKTHFKINPERDYDWLIGIRYDIRRKKFYLFSKQWVMETQLKEVGYGYIKDKEVTEEQLVERFGRSNM